ncbi:GGDEF domain-containing protein [Paraburkholderia aspalathi]|uniref:GGDEF domain-containing protein n=1 Tax=Paraburkholderia aspalathi TaxID=1324617 RepID=UPI0038BC389B
MTETLLDDGWLVFVGSEISPLKENQRSLAHAHERALHEARTDALTGLPNRRHVLAHLDKAIVTLPAPETPIAIALFDLDRFKNINDEQGHLAGDAVLCDFASPGPRPGPTLRRYWTNWGEEFLVVMPETTAGEALRVVERIRHAALSRIVPSPVGKPARYSVSTGITQVCRDDKQGEPFCRADRALYEAKRLGRNQVSVRVRSEPGRYPGHAFLDAVFTRRVRRQNSIDARRVECAAGDMGATGESENGKHSPAGVCPFPSGPM